jgi:RNA polymerase-binding transcription factor DksA
MDANVIRDRLSAKVREVLERNAKVTSDLRRERLPLEADWAENAILLENDEVLEALDADGRVRVAQLQAALARLDAGTYGRCASCGDEIAAERLDAMPEVTSCIVCARAAEVSGGPRR